MQEKLEKFLKRTGAFYMPRATYIEIFTHDLKASDINKIFNLSDYKVTALEKGHYKLVRIKNPVYPKRDKYGRFRTQKSRESILIRRINRNFKYRHERIATPKTLKHRGLTKYRSKRTPSGHVLRLAFPSGRRKKGAGELQAILHRKNPRKVEIYRRVGAIIAQKGRGHKCDAACKAANHWYIHKFKTTNPIYGEPGGGISIGKI